MGRSHGLVQTGERAFAVNLAVVFSLQAGT